MLSRLLEKWIPNDSIIIDQKTYMTRVYIRNGHKDRWGIRIHHIHLPDPGRELHDHPFDFVSLILRGSYDEVTNGSSKRRRWFSIAYRKAETLHRIDRLHGSVWTLVITSPHRRHWGFATRDGWVRHEEYMPDSSFQTEIKRG